jgi:hypothetical protein
MWTREARSFFYYYYRVPVHSCFERFAISLPTPPSKVVSKPPSLSPRAPQHLSSRRQEGPVLRTSRSFERVPVRSCQHGKGRNVQRNLVVLGRRQVRYQGSVLLRFTAAVEVFWGNPVMLSRWRAGLADGWVPGGIYRSGQTGIPSLTASDPPLHYIIFQPILVMMLRRRD